jgi:ParB family chromosome partitioning protein
LIDEFHLTQEEVAQKMGKSRSLVANTLRLLQLPAEIQRGLLEGKVNEGHAKAILSVEGTEKQMALYETIIKEQLTVREAERRSQMVTPKTYKRVSIPDPKAKEVEERLSEVLGTKVHVTHVGKGGRVSIEYYGPEDLDHLLTKLGA